MTEFSRDCKTGFAAPPVWHVDIPVAGEVGEHEGITQNFVDAILDGVGLIAPAQEGMASVEIANAMLYSSLIDDTVEMPLDAHAYELALGKLIADSSVVDG